MKYSQMSVLQRKEFLENPDSYPLYVTFMNKTGLLSFEEVNFLIENDVDFDVDDRQAAEVLGPDVVRRAAALAHPRRTAFYLFLIIADATLAAVLPRIRRLLRR